ncbi:MAG: response regulator [Roseobacter sp.]
MSLPVLDRVLLVDDDKVTNLMHARLIRKAGLAKNIDVATDGVAAIEYLVGFAARSETPPQIIFLDLNMPRMNGFEFLNEYKSLPESVREAQDIVMLSTSVLPADKSRAEADPDVLEFVTKPIRADKLLAIFEDQHARRAG